MNSKILKENICSELFFLNFNSMEKDETPLKDSNSIHI